MKKIITAVALITICAALIGFGSIAYFTASDTSHNTITTGSIDIALLITDANGDPFEAPSLIMPGDVIDEVVSVRNDGNAPAWIRVGVAVNCGELDSSLFEFNYNTEDWTYSEGYFYCNTPVEPNAVTEPLFSTVTASILMGNDFANGSFGIDLSAHAVQSANNGASVLEAAGWPAE